MKKITIKVMAIIASLLTPALLCLSSCESGNFPAQTDPLTEQFANGYGGNAAGSELEHDYSCILAFTDKNEYPTDFDQIKVTIENQNEGRGFYFFTIPVIEYFRNDKWVRLNYSPESYDIPEQWALCAIEGQPDKKFSTVMTIFHDKLKGNWKAGEYRAVVFAGTETLHAMFRLNDN